MIRKILKKWTTIPANAIGLEELRQIENEITIYNFRHLVKWDKDQIETASYLIKGDGFIVKEMDKYMVTITGQINEIIIKRKNA